MSNSDSEKDKILFCIKEGSSYVWKDITQATKEDIQTAIENGVTLENLIANGAVFEVIDDGVTKIGTFVK